MESATSFLFPNGEEVRARDCNYLSYKQLCLVCPACRHSVYLAAAESILRQPHFRHFPIPEGQEELLACERRTTPVSSQALKALVKVDREQRIRFLNQYFWFVFSSALNELNLQAFGDGSLGPFNELVSLLPRFHDLFRKGFVQAVKTGAIRNLIDIKVSQVKNWQGTIGSEDPERARRLKDFTESLNLEIQSLTVCGICDFLALKNSRNLLASLVNYALYDYLMYSADSPHEFPFEPRQIVTTFPWIVSDLLSMLIVIRWQESFAAAREGKPIPPAIHTRPRPAFGLWYSIDPAFYLWDMPKLS